MTKNFKLSIGFIIFISLVCCFGKASFAKINHLTYDTGHILASEDLKPNRDISLSIEDINCPTNIGRDLEKKLQQNNIEYKGTLLETLKNVTKYVEVCRIYNESMRSLLQCPKEEVQAPTAIIALLKIFCDVKRDVTMSHIECMANVEGIFLEKCQKGCLRKEVLKLGGTDSREISCIFAYCSTICLGNQISECGRNEDLKDIYYYLSGASMLLGVETALRHGVLPVQMLEAYNKIPFKCRKMMEKSVAASMGQF
uniref:Secreted protein n=1 Tax=Strongyloides venezuelensis TaxID=75913 RepID=A0A0K0FPJ1_STRVS